MEALEGVVGTATLFALGAAGGSLRGLVDVYNQTMAWQAARREHQRAETVEDAQPPPSLREFLDPVADITAAIFHMVLGAAGAALFGMSGQISGAYAAIAVGISAPALLTQLGRVQTINDAVTGVGQGVGSPPNDSTQPQNSSAVTQSHAPSGVGQEGAA
ncbi:hypothetical protein IM697_36840 [Streptomyces ferrugineus]|uniref:Uncharacterized protein n=1 Tax=Streptomyces ferrugineus TaxID=1413221 RepID=A0A7M2SGW9_9ACTN|nr:hypothetical protein [Streptomyces ferrugineus]QOV35570.1 hypothetical protein IM697_36840 [Streptomyces ferrugineus]